MPVVYVLLAVMGITSPVWAGDDKRLPVAPRELVSGYSYGYADKSVGTVGGVTKFTKQSKTILTITGDISTKWHSWERVLGPCYVHQPAVIATDSKGRMATIYRFKRGIIVDGPTGVWVVTIPFMLEWEVGGGYLGKLGWPINDSPR